MKNKKGSLILDVLDLTRVIDIYAESQAVQAFDAEMGKERKWIRKLTGFFARSWQRIGRDAWIDTKKREYITKVKTELKTGELSEQSLRDHITGGKAGIEDRSYLSHEQDLKQEQTPELVQRAVDAWMAAPANTPERTERIRELKAVIEASYPTVTTDMSQLEESLMRLERAKISSEVDTIETKLNILDLGRIEQGNGQRKEGWFVKAADWVSTSSAPTWLKNLAKHPNTAAILSALGTRWLISLAAWGAALGITWGLLVPVAVGSAAGGLFAGVRARREMRDRTAEIDRRGARGEETGHKWVDGESSNISHQTNTWQHPVMSLYTRVAAAREHQETRDDAMVAGLSYLVKHLVGREHGINMLSYDADKSVSRQHVEMIRLMNEVLPGLVSQFNDGSLRDTNNNTKEAQIYRALYTEITTLAKTTMDTRMDEEGKYATRQGLIFAWVGAVVGTTAGVVLHGMVSGANGHYIDSPTGSKVYPGGLKAYNGVHRGFWYDNGTPAPVYDHTELMIQTDKAGGWNVSHMLGKTASTLTHGNNTIHPTDFTLGKIQAVITPRIGWPSFTLPIDAQGNIQIPQSMQDAFDKRSFAFLEVGEVRPGTDGQIDLNPIATVQWSGNMVFAPILGKEWVAGDAPWWGIPVGANEYEQLGKSKPRQPISGFVSPLPSKEKPSENKPKTTDTDNTPQLPIVQDGWKNPTEWKNEPNKDKDIAPVKKESDDKSGDIAREKQSLDDLWAEIVKIRKALDGRHSGESALSDSAVANMRDTEAKLLAIYHPRKRAWNQLSESITTPARAGIRETRRMPATAPQAVDTILSAEAPSTETSDIDQAFATATRVLSQYTPVSDEILSGSDSLLTRSGGALSGIAHRDALIHLLGDAQKWGKTAKRALIAFYGKNGKIWVSRGATGGHNSTDIGNIAVGLQSSNQVWSSSYLSRRLYEISGATPIPEDPTIVLYHELGHQITKRARYAAADWDTDINSLITEIQILRDDQWAGITPLSSMEFYKNRATENPQYNTQFWEDMAELMGLYLMGREYVIAYLDDRISIKRRDKANIDDGLKDRIMAVLDTSYNHYIG
jgi:hypothetical protein